MVRNPRRQPLSVVLFVLILVLTPLVAVARLQPAAAAGVVSQCTETALRAALEGGGEVTFSCSGTILIASQIVIGANTVLDGGGQVTLDGGGSTRLMVVTGGVTLELRGLTLTGGVSTGSDGGAAILNFGNLSVETSTLHGNRAVWGGAIDNYGVLTVTASTLADNRAVFSGGAIYVNPGATATIAASTLEGNDAGSNGGVVLVDNDATVAVTASTLAGNTAGGLGGAIRTVIGGASTITASILSGHQLCNEPIASGGYNVASDASCNLATTGDLQNADPLLGPLQDNGGPTFTMLPQPGSPALDRVPNGLCAILSAATNGQDQRGSIRPVGNAPCDSGAVEVGVVIEDLAVSVDGTQATLLVTAFDPLGGPLAYRFACAGVVLGPQPEPEATCDFGNQRGQFAVNVEVTDSHGFGVLQTVLVTIPTYLCVGERSGTPRFMAGPNGCQRGEQPLVLNEAGSWSFCVGERSGSLRYLFNGNANCLRGEWKLTLPEQGPISVCVGERSRSMRYVANGGCLRGELAYVIANRVS